MLSPRPDPDRVINPTGAAFQSPASGCFLASMTATSVCLAVQEIRLLKRISFDRNIVQFYGACLESQPPMLVMEYMGVCPSLQPASTCALLGMTLQ